jgi:integrase/recombinase XerC
MEADLAQYINYLVAIRNASPYTVRNYRAEISQALEFLRAHGVSDWMAVDRPVLRKYLAWLAGQDYARASVARRVSELRAFGAYLVRERRAEHNPFGALEAPRTPSRLPRVLTPAEAQALMAAPSPDTPIGLRDRAILETLYGAGLRVSELVGLSLPDYESTARTLRVTGKGDRERVTLLGQLGAAALDNYLRHGRPALVHGRSGPAMFVNTQGQRLTTRSIQRQLVDYSLAVGLGCAVTPHVLRHSFATHLMTGGADLRVVQELLGHQSVATTQIYTHVSQAQIEKSYHQAMPRGRARPTEQDQEPSG